MRLLGMPYKGGKGRFAQKIVDLLPKADTLYDLFGGGGAVTHCAALNGKYKGIVYNDHNPLISDGFKNAVDGAYLGKREWISRERFFKERFSDPWIAICFSYCTNMRQYAYSREIEPWFKALFYARALGDRSLLKEFGIDSGGTFDELRQYGEEYRQKYEEWLGHPLSTKTMNRLVAIPRMERIENIGKDLADKPVSVLCEDYRDVRIEGDAVIYCDIPYMGCEGYKLNGKAYKFDYDEFYGWCGRQEASVYVSSKHLPESMFDMVDEWKSCLRFGNGEFDYAERLYKARKF